MKNRLKSLFFLVLVSSSTFAHNIWIEASQTGKVGKEQIAKVFLGGYGENERDSTRNWFSNTKDFAIWLIEPSGTKTQLTAKAAAIYFEAVFTPDKEGVYTLAISHEVAEVFGTTKYHYFATAQVKVGNATSGQNNLATATDLVIEPASGLKAQKPATLKIQYKSQNLDKTHASVGAPSGWAKGLETSHGSATFDAIWAGLYVAEASYSDKTEGSLNGKDFKRVQYVGTHSFYVGD